MILHGVDLTALEAAFRQHASSTALPALHGLVAVAIDSKTLRGSFDAFCDRKAAHMMSTTRQADQIVLGHLVVAQKSNEVPTAPELIEALGLKGCVFTLDAEHAKKKGLSQTSGVDGSLAALAVQAPPVRRLPCSGLASPPS